MVEAVVEAELVGLKADLDRLEVSSDSENLMTAVGACAEAHLSAQLIGSGVLPTATMLLNVFAFPSDDAIEDFSGLAETAVALGAKDGKQVKLQLLPSGHPSVEVECVYREACMAIVWSARKATACGWILAEVMVRPSDALTELESLELQRSIDARMSLPSVLDGPLGDCGGKA